MNLCKNIQYSINIYNIAFAEKTNTITSENTELWFIKSTGAIKYANLNAQRVK